jgi:hypothetical protein
LTIVAFRTHPITPGKNYSKVWTLLCILREQKPATGEESKKKSLKLELDGALDTLYLDTEQYR